MSLRPEVRAFVALGSLPSSEDAVAASVELHQALLDRICAPVTAEEAQHSDRCPLGLMSAWGLLGLYFSLIEPAPSRAVDVEPPNTANEWVRLLWERSQRVSRGS